MAFNSVLGVLVKSVTHSWQPAVYENWLAAAPVVALGAPLGVFIVEYAGRKATLWLVAALCLGQFVWTCHAERDALGVEGLVGAIVALGAFVVMFEWLRALGSRMINSHLERLELERFKATGQPVIEVAGVP
jgi:hypothetical protein